MNCRKGYFVISVSILLMAVNVSGQEVLSDEHFTVLDKPARHMMRDYLLHLADQQFYSRDSLLATLRTREEWTQHIDIIRDSMQAWTGEFPERTPLNARVTGSIDHPEYRVENILFESRPGFYVSGNLYLPKPDDGPYPAVLNVLGHTAEGKSAYWAQQRSIAQAKRGLVAFTIDGIGQGERKIREYTAYGSLPGGLHKGVGLQSFLLGWHVFNIMAWDAIRAIDYLEERPEVDMNHLAITGASGGGMLSTYLLPLEPRITVAIPTDNPSAFSYHMHEYLGTDHEQVFFGCFQSGIDMRGDPLLTHVPNPLLVNASIDDQLNPPRGVWEIGHWLEMTYATFNVPEKFKLYMSQSGHGYRDQDQREIAYAWMQRWMGTGQGSFREEPLPLEEPERLHCTSTGDVYTLSGSREPHDLLLEYLDENQPEWPSPASRSDVTAQRERTQNSIKQLLRLTGNIPIPIAEGKSAQVVGEKKVTRLVLKPEQGIILPAVMVEQYPPENYITWQLRSGQEGKWVDTVQAVPQGPVILYLHDVDDNSGKAGILKDPALLDSLVSNGNRVLTADLRGTGKTAPGLEGYLWDYLIGKPIFGQRVQDILSVVKWLSRRTMHTESITVWAQGVSGLHAAFATALDTRISKLVVEEPVLSFEDIVRTRTGPFREEILVPNVLQYLDMPQIYQAIAPRKLVCINPVTGEKTIAGERDVEETYQSVKSAYDLLESSQSLRLMSQLPEVGRGQLIHSIPD